MMKNKYQVLITSCWLLLVLCFAIKILGGNWFEIICENQTFINICNHLDNSYLKYVISTLVYVPSSYLIYLCLSKQKLGKDLWVMLIMVVASLSKWKLSFISLLLELSFLIVIPLFKVGFKKFLWVIIGFLLTFGFQAISLLTRNIGVYLENDSMLIGLIMQIDYYIMIILYYLYTRKRKEM